MISYNELIGLPVYLLNSNKKIATIKDILFSSNRRFLIGLVVEKKKFFGLPKYIPLDEIEKIENTFVMIRSLNSIKSVRQYESLYNEIFNSNLFGIDTEVYSNEGQKIGKINDIIFNFEIGTIDSYVISDGIIEDVISGRKIIHDDKVKVKRNKMFLKN